MDRLRETMAFREDSNESLTRRAAVVLHRITIGLGAIAIAIQWMGVALAQRVQFPTQVPTSTSAYPYSVAQPVVSPPPAWDPYSAGAPNVGPIGPPPVSTPYVAPNSSLPPVYPPSTPGYPTAGAPGYGAPSYGAPAYPSPAFPQQPGALNPNGSPFQWQQGTYAYQDCDGNATQFQRLLQNIGFEYTWLAGFDSSDPGNLTMNKAEVWSTFGFPIFYNTETPLLVTPGFAANFLGGPISLPTGGPDAPDLPPQLFDAYLDGAWQPQVNEWFGADLGVRVGVYSDFSYFTSESMRYMGRGLGVLSFTPTMKVAGGVWYIDRNDVKLLPAGGVIWTPNPDTNFRILFPNPKLAHRFHTVGTSDLWWYVAGEYGGGAYTIGRDPAANGSGVSRDNIDYNDIRVSLGLEWTGQRGVRGHIEFGYVFNREVVYAQSHAPPTYEPDDTLMIRGGIDY